VKLFSLCGLPVRLTRSVFRDLAIVMTGLGLLVGMAFPFATHLMGVPAEYAEDWRFRVYCVLAGLGVGGLNALIANSVVRGRFRLLSSRLEEVRAALERIQHEGDVCACSPAECFLPVDSDDELGRASESFNLMAAALSDALHTTFAVRKMTERLVEKLRLEEMARTALGEMLEHTASAGGALYLARDGQLELAASTGIVEASRLASHPMVLTAFETLAGGRLELPGGISLDRLVACFPPRAVLLEAVQYDGRALGVVLLASDRPYTEEEIRRLKLLSRPLALAFHNALAYDELERVAALDGLTGCYNRRFGLARLREEFARAVRMGVPLSVILMDLDHFKTVNDSWGHLAGDRVLMQIARQAKQLLRQGDLLVRYGGEEFLAVLPFTNAEEAAAAAERIRIAIAEKPVPNGRAAVPMTLSAGVAAWPETPAESEMQLVDQADAALYLAKRSGRNRVMIRQAAEPIQLRSH
jgi:diguanylate cyclase (GGDEF)-like protein